MTQMMEHMICPKLHLSALNEVTWSSGRTPPPPCQAVPSEPSMDEVMMEQRGTPNPGMTLTSFTNQRKGLPQSLCDSVLIDNAEIKRPYYVSVDFYIIQFSDWVKLIFRCLSYVIWVISDFSHFLPKWLRVFLPEILLILKFKSMMFLGL